MSTIEKIIFLLFTLCFVGCYTQEKDTIPKLGAIYIYFDANSKDCTYSRFPNGLDFKDYYKSPLLKKYFEDITIVGNGFKINKFEEKLIISKKEANNIIDKKLRPIIERIVPYNIKLNNYFKNIYVYDIGKKLAYPVSWRLVGPPPPIESDTGCGSPPLIPIQEIK